MAFKGSVYYLASEDIFSNGWVSSLIRYLVAPIPIKKQAADVKAVLTPEETNRVSVAAVEAATSQKIAYVCFTAWDNSAGKHTPYGNDRRTV